MDDTLIAAIQRFTLDARHLLEEEARNQIDGIYGWLPDGSFAPQKNYPALQQLEEARETRLRLEAYALSEKEAGIDPKGSRRKLVRETAFTWLNRLVALRLMEERSLLKTPISRLMESNAYLFWLADEIDPGARRLHDQGETPANSMGEGPRHTAFRRFLLWQCGELARDVSVLFDPETLASRLCPRPIVLRKLVTDMNVADISDAWKPGNEETIGWMYQAFNAEELQAAFAGAREQGKKFGPEDIPAVTQLFTLRWVVRYLIENTLGRYWVEMHPDSRFRNELSYLVPIEGKDPRPLKTVKQITFLDPACGSMHFGLVAFDLFVQMYLEEMENAGKPGWPEKPSVFLSEDIPSSIIFNNIHGIDLDLRAVQISALALFLRARSMSPTCAFTDCYLACANVEKITGGRLEDLVKNTQLKHPIYERILLALANLFRDSDNLGSLLRPEYDLERLISEERRKALPDRQFKFDFPNLYGENFKTKEKFDEFFGSLEEQILQYLDTLTRKSQDPRNDPMHIAAEAVKGLRFLRLVQQRYDIVVTNPPYLSNRKMNERLKTLMVDYYPNAKGDTYAAFIVRCQELLEKSGLMGMLAMHSFMFISSYEELRAELREQVFIETLSHFGGGLFAVGNPGTLQTAAFVFRKEPDERTRNQGKGIYFRLVRGKNAEAKRITFESAQAALHASQSHALVFQYAQKDFDTIPGKPWVYWLTESIQKTFLIFRLLQTISPSIHGTATYDNFRFLRFWWECGEKKICLIVESWEGFLKSNKSYVPYMKGGAPKAWYGNQEFVLSIRFNGKELKAFLTTKRDKIRGEIYLFHKGVTWSDVSSKGFAARFSPGGFIHDVKGMTCFPKEKDIPFILGILNSHFAKYVLAALNPTISNQVGDIERLPVPDKRSEKIERLVNQCVVLAKQNSQESEITYDFVHPLNSLDELKSRKAELSVCEVEIDREVSRLYGLTEEDLAPIEQELSGSSGTEDGPIAGDASDDEEPVNQEVLTPPEWALSWISYAVGIVLGRFEIGVPGGLGCGDFSEDVVLVLKGLIQQNGLLVNDPGQPLDLAHRVWQALTCMLEESEARDRIKIVLGEGDPLERLRGWFDRFTGQLNSSFWKYHFQMYRKRPVYWPLQSPGRHYTVWVFQERFTADTLFHIRNDIVEPRLRLADREIADLRPRAETDRRARKELDRLRDFADDLREFSKRIKAITDSGYNPHIDDGVLLNAAPLHEILPSWPETKKAWQELERGDYDWALQAMEYWPDRIKEKCKTNKSFAIAHGLENTK